MGMGDLLPTPSGACHNEYTGPFQGRNPNHEEPPRNKLADIYHSNITPTCNKNGGLVIGTRPTRNLIRPGVTARTAFMADWTKGTESGEMRERSLVQRNAPFQHKFSEKRYDLTAFFGQFDRR
jgi:hypothetical protein